MVIVVFVDTISELQRVAVRNAVRRFLEFEELKVTHM